MRLLSLPSLLIACALLSPASYAQMVKTAPLQNVLYFPEYQFTGEVVPKETSQVSAELSAKLLELAVSIGDVVNQGDLLAALDCRDYQDKLALNQSAKKELLANLKLAKLQYDRLTDLNRRQLTADSAKDEALARKQALEAQLAAIDLQMQITEREISRCQITAPYQGVVTSKLVGAGQWLNPGTPVVMLTRLDNAEIEVKIPLAFAKQPLLKGAQWLNPLGQTQSLRWLRASSVLAAQSKMRPVWFAAPDSLLIGQTLSIGLQADQPYLPADYIVRRNGKLGFFADDQGVAKFVPIKGAQAGRPAPIEQALQSMKLVVDGQQSLQAGERLQEILQEAIQP